MNLIFKIVEYLEGTDQIIVKFCRQNSPKSIDEYPPIAIDCCNVDLNNFDQFASSILRYGADLILRQESEEPTLPENVPSEVIDSADIKVQLNRVISMNSNDLIATTYRMNKIRLD